MGPEVSPKRHAMFLESPGPQGDPSTPNKALNLSLPHHTPLPPPWLWVPGQHPRVPGEVVAHLSGSVATTEVVLLGKPAGHWPRQLRLLHLQQGQQRVGCPLDVVGAGVAFLPTFALWGDIDPSVPSRDDFSPHQVTHNYLSSPTTPPGFAPPPPGRPHLWKTS